MFVRCDSFDDNDTDDGMVLDVVYNMIHDDDAGHSFRMLITMKNADGVDVVQLYTGKKIKYKC